MSMLTIGASDSVSKSECKGHCIYKTPLEDVHLQAMAPRF
jgi:hypothetical protein